jgi:hypothetical protein
MRQAAKWLRSTLPLAARCKLNVIGCHVGTFACGWRPSCFHLHAADCQMAEKDLAAGSPLQAQFVCDWLPPWYFLHATGGRDLLTFDTNFECPWPRLQSCEKSGYSMQQTVLRIRNYSVLSF